MVSNWIEFSQCRWRRLPNKCFEERDEVGRWSHSWLLFEGRPFAGRRQTLRATQADNDTSWAFVGMNGAHRHAFVWIGCALMK